MENIGSSIIGPVVQSLMVPLKKHLGFLFSSTEYVNGMNDKMDQLKLTEQDIRHNWEEAIARNHEVSHHVEPWLKKVQKTKEEAQLIPTSGIGCFNIVKRYKIGKQSYNILGKIQDLETRKSDIVFTNTQIALAEAVSTFVGPSTSARDATQNNFKSRDAIYKAALKSLQQHNKSEQMIALCGMGGVGKTTMMEQLKKDVVALKLFDLVVKVVVGETTNLFALQSDIAEYIGENLSEKAISARGDRIRMLFEGMSQKGQKKILVIMDDLWNDIDLKDVGLTRLPDGFKLFFTSRFERVCTQMGVHTCSIFHLGVLDDAEAQTLFFENVEPSEGDDPMLRKLGEYIVTKCGGLPIAIVTIARSLCGNIKEVWEMALWRLEKNDLKDFESITRRVFEISYENIKEGNEKAIYLLSGLFPDDFDIRTEDLLRFGWALGFFKDAGTLGVARKVMKICVNNLIRANLLTKSGHMGCVRVHDLVRAFVLNKISEVKQASIVSLDNKSEQGLTKDAKESYDRILLKCTGITEFPADFNYPNLSMLMLMDGHGRLKFPENIYDRMEKLLVVSYEKMFIPSLLLRFEHSTKLRTLCLRSCRFINGDISFLGSLCSLETLSIVDCGIRWLPSAIGKLKKLKLLDLTGCVHLRIDDGVFQNLDRLKELYMRTYEGPFEDSNIMFTKANCDELEILSRGLYALELEFFENMVQPKNVSIKNLERFKISIGCKLAFVGEKNSFRNTIQFVGECNELLECKISELFDKTDELHLKVKAMNHLEDILQGHTFSDLRVLHISECPDLTCLFTVDVASGLTKLEQLTISKCPVMRTLIVENSRVDVIRFQKMICMSLIDLPNMVSLWDNKIELPEMVELTLDGLPNFISIYPHGHNMSEMQSFLNKKVVIPNLKKLIIFRMENLKHIWSCETTDENNVSMIRNTTLSECDNLMNLFPSNPFSLLKHLEEVEVYNCGSIEVLFNMEFESVCGTYWEYDSSKLRSICVDKLGKLKELWRMKCVDNKCDIHVKCFKGVESITVTDCPVFKNIFTPTTVNFDLGGLTRYYTDKTGEEISDISKEEPSTMDEDIHNVTYPSYLLQTCHRLQYLRLENDKRVKEVVFEMDSHQPLLLPCLEFLDIDGLKEMSHVWKCNWNKFSILHHPPLQLPFQNLTKISLRSCPKLKYLFSPLMAICLSNLKTVDIRFCDGIEEVISSRDDENEENTSTSASSHQNSTFFPHLETLRLYKMSCLKSIDGGDQTRIRSDTNSSSIITNTIHDQSQQSGQVIHACWSLCQYAKRIDIYECPVLSRLIPWYAVGQMKLLQELTIRGCHHLPHVFTFSTLESLNQLKELTVRRCNGIKVIIVEEENIITSSKDVVVFPRLQTLVLDELPNLECFFSGMNEFRWPKLDDVMINDCPQLMMFTSGQSITPQVKYICTSLGKHSLECGLNFHGAINGRQTTFPASSDTTISKGTPCSFHNLIEINKRYMTNVGRSIIPSNVLLQLEKLEKIDLLRCLGVEEVFEVVDAPEGQSGLNESQTTTTLVQIPNLKQVDLISMHDLKYLWKSNRSMVLLEFPNLTTLSIQYCQSLEHVFTCSMVGSLVQLQDLEIRECENIEVIVKEEEEESEDNSVMLPCLKSLKLQGLPKLKGFCLGKEDSEWPLLDTLLVRYCRAFEGFTKGYLSTPKLKVIKTTFGKWYVNSDLNSFIKIKQGQGFVF